MGKIQKPILISHRANLDGRIIEKENNPDYIKSAIEYFHVEIDVWNINNNWFLGHDKPQYKIGEIFLQNDKFYCHAKNLDAFNKMLDNKKIHCFWHQNDDYALTSKGFIWTYPKKQICEKSIIVSNKLVRDCYGICTDYPLKLERLLK
ncbi:MAG: hypothetical protein AABY22_26065 [Nanoarchaeota archaeon]|mgnify:CR=1 FL=1